MRWGVQRRPKPRVVQVATWAFLVACTATGGLVGAIVADRARVARNTRRWAA